MEEVPRTSHQIPDLTWGDKCLRAIVVIDVVVCGVMYGVVCGVCGIVCSIICGVIRAVICYGAIIFVRSTNVDFVQGPVRLVVCCRYWTDDRRRRWR
jgi:hypothetical protein